MDNLYAYIMDNPIIEMVAELKEKLLVKPTQFFIDRHSCMILKACSPYEDDAHYAETDRFFYIKIKCFMLLSQGIRFQCGEIEALFEKSSNIMVVNVANSSVSVSLAINFIKRYVDAGLALHKYLLSPTDCANFIHSKSLVLPRLHNCA